VPRTERRSPAARRLRVTRGRTNARRHRDRSSGTPDDCRPHRMSRRGRRGRQPARRHRCAAHVQWQQQSESHDRSRCPSGDAVTLSQPARQCHSADEKGATMTRGTPVKAILHASIRTSRPAPIHGCGPTRSQGQRSPDRNTRARVPKRAAQVERRVTVEPTGARNQAKASLVRDFEWSLSRETISREPRRLADSLHHLPTPTACAGYRGRCTGGRLVVVGRERGIEPHGLPAAVPEVEVVVVVALSAGCFAASLRKGHRRLQGWSTPRRANADSASLERTATGRRFRFAYTTSMPANSG